MKEKGNLIIISGFSGAGKGTVVKALLETSKDLALSVSATTRNQRPGEIDGKHYHFLSKEAFQSLIEEDALYEYANYLDHYYGTPKAFVKEKLNAGIDVILEIEMQGALQVKEVEPEAILVFIIPPHASLLKDRLVHRNTEAMEVIEKRLNRSREETPLMEKYDYIVVNDDLELCVSSMTSIIQAEKIKNIKKDHVIQQFLREFDELLKGE